MLGAEVYHGIDDEVWSPTESVNDANCNNHFCDVLTHSYDTLKQKIAKHHFKFNLCFYFDNRIQFRFEELLGRLLAKNQSFSSVVITPREDFRYMKIHIFALQWRDEIKRSSQLRTLLKRVVVNRT